MKKTLIALFAAAGLVLSGAATASATDPANCVPADAWTETVEHPAVGEPTIEIDNPDYVPAVEEVTEVVHHDAETVDHPAVTQTQWKYTKHGGHGFLWLDNNDHKYVDANGNAANWKDWLHFTVYERTSHTQEVTISEAWTETIKEAWDETVVVTPAQPAQGEPTITVDNPDYVAAWTETIEHPAVTCNTDEEPELIERWWLVPEGVEPVDNRVDENGFPQTPLPVGEVPCERWAQIDWYPADAPIDEWLADGVLSYGEDWGYVDQGHVWDFAYGGECDNVIPPVETPEVPSDDDTPTVPTATPTPPNEIQTAAPGELAVTGAVDTAWGYTLGALGVGAAALGAILLYGARSARRR